jgi:transposase InsO family protein
MKAIQVVQALKMAVKGNDFYRGAIHHSDRGLQYCSETYQSELSKAGIRPSMTDGYDCYQNALAERVNGILKQEFLIYDCKTFEDLAVLIDESVNTYNHLRPHLSLKMKTPNQVRKEKGQLQELA